MLLIGVDEAGRGAWAGPLVAAAVALNQDIQSIPGLKDSKQLSAKGRQALYDIILSTAKVGIGLVEPSHIDSRGLSWAQARAMSRAVRELGQLPPAEIIIDGSIDYLKLPNSRPLVRADSSVPAVMAASIIAKVYRDGLMGQLEDKFPGYGFASHKGYGTQTHAQALKDLGVCQIHRRSYKPVAAWL